MASSRHRRHRYVPALCGLTLLLLAGCATGGVDPAAKPSWAGSEPPVVEVTDEVRTDGATLVDGTYWADAAAVSGGDSIVFRVTRVRFGAACETWAAEMLREDACLNDYGVEAYPEAYASIAPYAVVSVADPAGPGRNLLVDAPTLVGLVRGAGIDGPAGYTWVPFPFVVEVEDGTVVRAEQLWVP